MTVLDNDILEILADVCDCDDVLENPQMELLESNVLDSLSFILLLQRLDEDLDVEIQPTQVDINIFKTPQTLIDYIKGLE